MNPLSGETLARLGRRHWRVLATGSLLTTVTVLMLALAQPVLHAWIASVDLVPQVEASGERRATLAALVTSPEVEARVQESLGPTLPEALRTRGRLTELVSGELKRNTELISITVHAGSATLAEEIALAWTSAFASYAHELYVSSAAVSIENRAVAASGRYTAAEQRYAEFVGSSPLWELAHELDDRHRMIEVLMEARRRDIAAELARGVGVSASAPSANIHQLERELLDLQTRIAAETAKYRQLEADLLAAWDDYRVARVQHQRSTAAGGGASRPVVIPSSDTAAVKAVKPPRRPLELLLPLAAVVGAMVPLVALTVFEYVRFAVREMRSAPRPMWPVSGRDSAALSPSHGNGDS